MIEHFERLFAHLAWANTRLLREMNLSGRTEGKHAPRVVSHLDLVLMTRRTPFVRVRRAMRVFAHLLASERVWLLRIEGKDSAIQPIWPAADSEAMNRLAKATQDGYARLLGSMRDPDLEKQIAYTNQHGRFYRTALNDILTHVAMHGSYHRGQIARAVRWAGGEPIDTDFITFARAHAAVQEAADALA